MWTTASLQRFYYFQQTNDLFIRNNDLQFPRYLLDITYWKKHLLLFPVFNKHTVISNFQYEVTGLHEFRPTACSAPHMQPSHPSLRVWRSRLNLVSAPGQGSSACPKSRPRSDTLKQSRLIQQSISSLHFLCSCYLSQPPLPLLCLNTLIRYHSSSLYCFDITSVVSTFQEAVDSWDEIFHQLQNLRQHVCLS